MTISKDIQDLALKILGQEAQKTLSTCLKSSITEFAETYSPQIVTCLIYDSIIDLCVVESLSYFATFIIGITFLSSYEIEKTQVLSVYIAFSVFFIFICKLCEKFLEYKITAILYTVLNFAVIILVNVYNDQNLYGFENPENRRFLVQAFMNFFAYTVDVVNNPYRDGFMNYFSFHFLGYMFNPINVLNGPWLPLEMYCKLFVYKKSVLYNSKQSWNKTRIWKVLKYCTISYCFYISGKCILPTINTINGIWFPIYFKCLEYRLLHYAHYNMCTASVISAGQHFYYGYWQLAFTYPSVIEFPISLTTAVESYDRQLTFFIKKYFSYRFDYMRSIYPRSDLMTFPLIYLLITNFDNWPLPIAILTLYTFVHTQSICQTALANGLNICVQRYPCIIGYCSHKFKANHPLAIACKLCFLILNAILVNYIHIVIIEEDYKTNWKEMHYIGHHISMAYFIISIFVIDVNPQIVHVDTRYPNLFERSLASSGYKFMVDKVTETDSYVELVQKGKVKKVDSSEIYKKKQEKKTSK